jgi:hypothetical protein
MFCPIGDRLFPQKSAVTKNGFLRVLKLEIGRVLKLVGCVRGLSRWRSQVGATAPVRGRKWLRSWLDERYLSIG